MSQRPIIWLCLADGEHAKILTPNEDGFGYGIVTAFDSADAHKPSRALGTSRPPRVQESGYTGRHAIAPRLDPHLASKVRFMQAVADFLNRARAGREYDSLVLIAPTRCLRPLRDSLDAPTLRCVCATQAKDMMKVPLAQLSPELLNATAPVAR